MQRLVLASTSPRRVRMLKRLGVEFEQIASCFCEPAHDGRTSAAEYVQANARGKADRVAAQVTSGLVIGCDTIVVYRRRVLGKPATRSDAREYLRLLRGKTHAVYSGLCIIDADSGVVCCDYEKTLVRFRGISDAELDSYLAAINPMDKAGAYAIQGAGAIIVSGISGCYYNVVGFPLAKLEQLLELCGVSLFDYMM
ncbi:MAG: septum formation protein Maf [Deltaproteobacteria bacterium]|nr:septum formation protein Maf [Deltaproteobacteria bacterium]